jgi:hypothetical protein
MLYSDENSDFPVIIGGQTCAEVLAQLFGKVFDFRRADARLAQAMPA